MQFFTALNFYGALAIAGFGWALGRELGWDPQRYVGLWVAAALLVYNVDRLVIDPADRINTPLRAGLCRHLRGAGRFLTVFSALLLLIIPVFEKNWLLLGLTVAGALCCLTYSLPVFGRRLKDMPLLKTLFAPSLVLAACVVPPFLDQGLRVGLPLLAFTLLSAWCLLLFNMTICDLRDLDGDRQYGIRSLPVLLGRSSTFRALRLMRLICLVSCFFCVLLAANDRTLQICWLVQSALTALAMSLLLKALQQPQTESFYEWYVEGLLLLPLLAGVVAALTG